VAGQNLVAVHLFEWPWEAVAAECRERLGPGGYNVVQVSPPQEHNLGGQWWVRYQPVSYKLDSRSGTPEQFASMVRECREAGVEVMVDAVVNHMAGPLLFAPPKDFARTCSQEQDSPSGTTRPCRGFSGTEYANREFLHGQPGLDRFTKADMHHYAFNSERNCETPQKGSSSPVPPTRYYCDFSGLVDLDTENLAVQDQITTFLFQLFELGVTALRIDAAVFMYPVALAHLVQPIPWRYLVQELYPDGVMPDYFRVGQVTDMTFGWNVSWAFNESGAGWPFSFREVLRMANHTYRFPRQVHGRGALVFVANQDTVQKNISTGHESTLNFESGALYRLAQLLALAMPYGDAVRVMSSYAGPDREDMGPPGIQTDEPNFQVYTPSPVRCKDMPTTYPPSDDFRYGVGWICEHRWRGMSGLVRFRRSVGPSRRLSSATVDGSGFVSFAIAHEAFVAMNVRAKGALRLAGQPTSLPAGAYCNLADLEGPVPAPEEWRPRSCARSAVWVDDQGAVDISSAPLPPLEMVALHRLYPAV